MNIATLAAELSELREIVVTLKAALELSRQENSLLRQKIDALGRRVFGAGSELVDRKQNWNCPCNWPPGLRPPSPRPPRRGGIRLEAVPQTFSDLAGGGEKSAAT